MCKIFLIGSMLMPDYFVKESRTVQTQFDSDSVQSHFVPGANFCVHGYT